MALETCLIGDTYVSKTHPRIVFRGMLDRLEAQVALLQAEYADHEAAASLGDILRILQNIMRAEVLDRSVPPCTIGGQALSTLHALSHDPPGGHCMIDPSVGVLCAKLNLLRTNVRALEIAAINALPERTDICDTLNRLSGAVYTLFCTIRENERKEGAATL